MIATTEHEKIVGWVCPCQDSEPVTRRRGRGPILAKKGTRKGGDVATACPHCERAFRVNYLGVVSEIP